MRKHFIIFATIVFAGLVLFASCTDFFSASWAKWAARDPDKLIPKVTTGNVNDLVAKAENNPDLSLALLKKIQDAANSASGNEKLKLQSAALGAATNAVGLGQAVLGAAGSLTSLSGDTQTQIEDAKNMVLNAINSLQNLDATSSALVSIVPNPYDADGNITPEFQAFSDTASANDLAMAAAVLIAGQAKNYVNDPNNSDDPDDYISSLGNRIDGTSTDPLTDQENYARAMALAAAAVSRSGELSGPLQDVLSGLNLVGINVNP